jgi:hypothetical protein
MTHGGRPAVFIRLRRQDPGTAGAIAAGTGVAALGPRAETTEIHRFPDERL